MFKSLLVFSIYLTSFSVVSGTLSDLLSVGSIVASTVQIVKTHQTNEELKKVNEKLDRKLEDVEVKKVEVEEPKVWVAVIKNSKRTFTLEYPTREECINNTSTLKDKNDVVCTPGF